MEGLEEEDEEVVFEGSPIHEHLKREGLMTEGEAAAQAARVKSPSLRRHRQKTRDLCRKWPTGVSDEKLEVDVAQRLLASELLIQEDEDFLNNFILTEEALALASQTATDGDVKAGSGRGLLGGDALFISGSLAAAATTVLFLSERTQLAAAVAAALPTALAMATAVTGALADDESTKAAEKLEGERRQFEALVDQLLEDMKSFKQLVRKSLNLLQGMELMQSGYMFAVDSNTGGPVTVGEGCLTKAIVDRASFPALRKATYYATVELIKAYRQSVEKLMEVSPLTDHVDLRDHYIAFIDLKNFGISDELLSGDPKRPITVGELKDVAQLGLIQQSEYLRRFALAFASKVREDNVLNKDGLLEQVKDLIGTLNKINSKLTRVFEYHQAMGVIPEKKKHSLAFKQQQSAELIPLRSVYTSLFSTGLHLQNSLLKVRQLEKTFDKIEKQKAKEAEAASAVLPSEEHLAEWFKGFQTIQKELNACVGCLDDGMSSIQFLTEPDEQKKSPTATKSSQSQTSDHTAASSLLQSDKSVLVKSDDPPRAYEDEVFEAVICDTDVAGEEAALESEDKKKLYDDRRYSKKLLEELRLVLAKRAAERERREALALAKKNGDNGDGEPNGPNECNEDKSIATDAFILGDCEKDCNATPNAFEDSFSNVLIPPLPTEVEHDLLSSPDNHSPSSASSSYSTSSSSSGRATVKSFSKLPSSSGHEIPTSISGQRLVDEGADSSDSSSSSTYEDHDEDEECEDEEDVGLRMCQGDGPTRPLRSSPLLNANSEGKDGSLSELRVSVSSPDISRLAGEEESNSPYVSLERLLPAPSRSSNPDSSPESADSADEAVRPLRTFRRPLRPAAAKAKRARNRTVALRNGALSSATTKNEDDGDGRDGFVLGGTYVAKNDSKDNPLFVPERLAGFDASIAAEAARRALKELNGVASVPKREEEVFGSDSD